jgi:hypothetical protein
MSNGEERERGRDRGEERGEERRGEERRRRQKLGGKTESAGQRVSKSEASKHLELTITCPHRYIYLWNALGISQG